MKKSKFVAVILASILMGTTLVACKSVADPTVSSRSTDSSESTVETTLPSQSETEDGNGTELPAETTTDATTETPTTSELPSGLKRAADLNLADYDAYTNTSTNWWYKRPTVLGEENRDTIDIGVMKIVDPFRSLYQDPTTERRLYLTFDAGYEYKNNTAEILDILLEKGVKASFFITGGYQDQSPQVVKRMVNEGHLVGNHTLDHKDPVKTLNEEGILAMALDVEANADKFAALTGSVMPLYLRPGQGIYSEKVLAIYADMGYRSVFWDFAYRDWFVDDQPDPTASYNQITGELHPGSVILLHAVSDTNVAVLPQVIDYALAEGYSFHLVSEHP